MYISRRVLVRRGPVDRKVERHLAPYHHLRHAGLHSGPRLGLELRARERRNVKLRGELSRRIFLGIVVGNVSFKHQAVLWFGRRRG
jgi:hypothetical protein